MIAMMQKDTILDTLAQKRTIRSILTYLNVSTYLGLGSIIAEHCVVGCSWMILVSENAMLSFPVNCLFILTLLRV